jgi:hypothetical protein
VRPICLLSLEEHWKNECPQQPRDPRRPPRPEAELLKESIGLLRGEATPRRKTSFGWPLLRTMRKTSQTRLHSTGPPEAYGPNEDRRPSH